MRTACMHYMKAQKMSMLSKPLSFFIYPCRAAFVQRGSFLAKLLPLLEARISAFSSESLPRT
jgi:hypothetical protein